MGEFRVWAPDRERVRVRLLDGDTPTDHPMTEDPNGWWHVDLPLVDPGTDYYIVLDDDEPRPDPRSVRQPHGATGPSRTPDPHGYAWSDAGWTGRSLPGSIVYELHIGTFTPGGTFDAAIERLDHLVDLGVDLVELLPVNTVNGIHNWGYDGVFWYAVHEPYGGPDGLKRFVDACHGRGIGVLLDVVYNHVGPTGDWLADFGPYFTAGRSTWGRLINLDGPGSDQVRAHIVDNALMWLRDYHLDGLRLDAVHALVDHRATHLLEELAAEVDALSTYLRRPLTLIAESDLNDPRLITPAAAGGYGLSAQWNDDVHHALHATLTGERHGYYADFGSLTALAGVLTRGFHHAGTWSSFRGRTHGRPVDTRRVPGYRFVAYLQNHDQIGNRAIGDRLSAIVSADLLRVGATLLLTSPFTPMLFMGEEWGASTPWCFFTSHPQPELAAVVGPDRVREFAAHGWPAEGIPEPQDPDTFTRSVLDWSERDRNTHADLYDYYRRLIAVRKTYPELSDPRLDRVAIECDEDARWLAMTRGQLAVVCNLNAERQAVPVDGRPVGVCLASAPGFLFTDGRVELAGRSAIILDLGHDIACPWPLA